jgi:hypothetical protein
MQKFKLTHVRVAILELMRQLRQEAYERAQNG